MKIFCLLCVAEHDDEQTLDACEAITSYRAAVNTAGDPEGVFTPNALRFPTAKDADDYARDLACRWTAVRDWRVEGCDDEVNR